MADLTYGVNRTPWGTVQIVVGGRDITWLRDGGTELVETSSGDPFGDLICVIRLPQVDVDDTLGTGDLDWATGLDAPPDVDIYHVNPDGTSGAVLWEGLVEQYRYDSGALELWCHGAMMQVDDYTRLPLYPEDPVGYEQLFSLQFQQSSRPALRVEELEVEGDPPFATRRTGSGDRTLTSFLQDLLSVALDRDTGQKWTLQLDPGRQPVFRPKGLTTVHYTVDARAVVDGQGVGISLTGDTEANTIYGEGQDSAGVTWRRQRDDVPGVQYEPLAIDPRVDPDDPAFDPRVRRIERYINFGTGVSETDALDAAAEIVDANGDTTWAGTITAPLEYLLTAGAIPRGGQNLNLTNWRGGTTLLHVATCRIDWTSGSVTLQVDSKGRDYLTLIEILRRNAEEESDPGYRLRRGANSTAVEDEKIPWMSTSGFVPQDSHGVSEDAAPVEAPEAYVDCPADEWTVVEVRGATLMTIRRILVEAHNLNGTLNPIPFYLSLLDVEPDIGIVPYVRGNVENTDGLTATDTTLEASALADVPAVSSPNILELEISPNSDTPEVVHITDHAEGATTATIDRGKDGTEAQVWPEGRLWVVGDPDGVYLPADPENEATPWNHPRGAPWGELEGWGVAGERCGYSPIPGTREGNKPQSEGGDPTGVFVDESPYSFELPEGRRKCFLAIFPVGDSAWFRGRLTRGVE